MPRRRKATKRAASHRHHTSTRSQRSSRNATAQPIAAASTSSASIRAHAPMTDTPITTLVADSPLHKESQDHQNPQDPHDRRAHPEQAALKERAFALSCIGHRSPAIAVRLGIPERTIRRWNRATLQTLALDATDASPDLSLTANLDVPATADAGAAAPSDATPDPSSMTPDLMEYHRALAIERQLDIAVTARAAYDRLMAQHDHLLAQYIAACDANLAATATAATTDEASPAPPLPAAVASMARLIPQLASSAARQLQIAQAAHREVARLQGVTTYAQTDARLSAEYEAKQAHQAAAPVEEQGGHVPIRFFDPSAALNAICGLEDDDEDDEDDDTATSAPTHNASSVSAAKTANDSGHDSGHIPGHRFTKADAEAAIDDIAGGS
ncbi:MAG: hypothetical protein ACXVDA_24540 [Ktedonobacterales bacterium]